MTSRFFATLLTLVNFGIGFLVAYAWKYAIDTHNGGLGVFAALLGSVAIFTLIHVTMRIVNNSTK